MGRFSIGAKDLGRAQEEKWGVAPQLLTTSNFIGPWCHAALLFSGLGLIVLLFGVLFSQQIREDIAQNGTRSLLRPSHAPLRSVNLVFDPKSARTRLGTRQVYRVILTFESVDKILKCDHSNESH